VTRFWIYLLLKSVTKSIVFNAKLKKGPIALHTWFRGEDLIFSAYCSPARLASILTYSSPQQKTLFGIDQ